MPRTLTATVAAAVLTDNVRPINLIEMYFDSGTVYHTHAPYDFTWNGNLYASTHGFATIDPVQESSSLEATGMSGTLIADSVNMPLALSEDIQGRKIIIRIAFLDVDHQIVIDPVVAFEGRMDTMSIELGDKATIKLTAESRFAAWDTPRVRRWNHADQISRYPSDMFFEFVPQMVARQINWGVTSGAVGQPVSGNLVQTVFNALNF